MRGLLACGMVALAFALGACGDDNEEPTGSSEDAASSAPEASAPVDEAVTALNEAIASQDCEQLMEITFSVLRVNADGDGPAEPGQPVQPEECSGEAPAPGLLKALEGTTFEQTEDYGAGAISDGTGGKETGGYDHWSVIWAVDRDGQYRNLAFYPADPQFEEDLPTSVDPVAVTEEMLSIIESGDCANADQVFGEGTRFGASPEEACEALSGGTIFAPAVKAAGDDALVEELGASRDYALVGVDTGDTYFLVHLATPPIKPDQPVQDEIGVVDVVPLTDFEVVEPEEQKK